MADEAIGMMDKAYFVGKVVIIEWLNDLLQVGKLAFRNLISLSLCSCAFQRLRSVRLALSTAV